MLGTQDKPFFRLLDTIDKEIEKGKIHEKVIVQAGYTKYQSSHMKIFDFIPHEELEDLINQSSLIITHGGVGSILSSIKKRKKVIAAPRLVEYKEHTNNHQIQIVQKFAEEGYILALNNFSDLEKVLEEAKTFKPKKFVSNTPHMVSFLDSYIEKDNHTSWYNRYKEVILYLIFGAFTTLVNILSFFLLRIFSFPIYVANFFAWFFSVLFAFFTNKNIVFSCTKQEKKENVRQLISFFFFRILSLGIDMVSMYFFLQVLLFHELTSKVISNVIVIVMNYIFSKVFVFKKK